MRMPESGVAGQHDGTIGVFCLRTLTRLPVRGQRHLGALLGLVRSSLRHAMSSIISDRATPSRLGQPAV